MTPTGTKPNVGDRFIDTPLIFLNMNIILENIALFTPFGSSY
jgi:hypothetical protein